MTATNVLGIDTFVRSNQSGWGTSSGGDAWAAATSNGTATVSISANTGLVTGASTGQANLQLLSTKTVQNCELLVKVQISSIGSSTGTFSVVARSDGSAVGNYYRLALSTNLTIQKAVSGSFTTLGTATFAASNNTYYWLRFRLVGTDLLGKVWADGSSEPGSWNINITDSTYTAAGRYGLRGFASSGQTNTVASFTMTDASYIDSTAIRAVVATTVAKSAAMRTRIATKVTKSAVLRAVIRTAKTVSTQFRIGVGPAPLASDSYKNTVLADSPTAYYRADDSSGTTAVDSSGNGNNATLSGTFTLSQTGLIAGDTDTSILFNGLSGFLTLPYTLNPTTWTSISLEYWIKIASGPMHVVVTSNSTSTILYLNGQVYSNPANGSGDAILVDQNILFAGSYSDGDLDEIALYQNVVLTPAQVRAHYAAGLAITKSVGVRTRVATRVTRSANLRAVIAAKNTRSAVLRVIVLAKDSVSTKLRTVIRTLSTATAKIRIPVRTQTTRTAPIRNIVATKRTNTANLRASIGTKVTRSTSLRTVIRGITLLTRMRMVIATKVTRSSVLRLIIKSAVTRSTPLRIVARTLRTISIPLRTSIRTLVTKTIGMRAVIANRTTRLSPLRIVARTPAQKSTTMRTPVRSQGTKSSSARTVVRTLTARTVVLRVITTADGTIVARYAAMRSVIATRVTSVISLRTRVRVMHTITLPIRAIIRTLTSKTVSLRAHVSTKIGRTTALRTPIATKTTRLISLRLVARGITLPTQIRARIRTQGSRSVITRLLIRTQRSLTTQMRLALRSTQTRTLALRTIARTAASRSLIMRTSVATKISKTLGMRLPIRTQYTPLIVIRMVLRTPQSRSLSVRIKARTQVSRSFVLRLRARSTAVTSVALRVMVVAPVPPPETVHPIVTLPYSLGATACFPITLPLAFPLIMNSAILDTPVIVTAPLLQGGQVLYGQSFTITWISPSSATQTAITNGATGSMTFAVHDGSPITAPVRIATVTIGSMLIATMTVTANTPTDKRVIKTQFY